MHPRLSPSVRCDPSLHCDGSRCISRAAFGVRPTPVSRPPIKPSSPRRRASRSLPCRCHHWSRPRAASSNWTRVPLHVLHLRLQRRANSKTSDPDQRPPRKIASALARRARPAANPLTATRPSQCWNSHSQPPGVRAGQWRDPAAANAYPDCDNECG